MFNELLGRRRNPLSAYERFCIAMFFQVMVVCSACICAVSIVMSPTGLMSAYFKLTMLGAFWIGLVVLNIKVKQSVERLRRIRIKQGQKWTKQGQK